MGMGKNRKRVVRHNGFGNGGRGVFIHHIGFGKGGWRGAIHHNGFEKRGSFLISSQWFWRVRGGGLFVAMVLEKGGRYSSQWFWF